MGGREWSTLRKRNAVNDPVNQNLGKLHHFIIAARHSTAHHVNHPQRTFQVLLAIAFERYWSSARNVSDLMLISEKGIERCPTCSYWLFVSPRFPHTRDRRSIGVAIVVFSISVTAYLQYSVILNSRIDIRGIRCMIRALQPITTRYRRLQRRSVSFETYKLFVLTKS
jgi:hypothetical protein